MYTNIISKNESDCKPDAIETIRDTGEILEDKSATGRVRPWSERKAENMELQELFTYARAIDPDIISDSRLLALKDCASWLEFAEAADRTRKLAHANFCRLRLCPMCAWRRSLKLFSQVSRIVDAILVDKKARFIFVTLTIRNIPGEQLREAIKLMNDGFKRMTGKGKGGLSSSEKFRENLLGYMKAIEVTYNVKRDDFHPHIHAIFEVKPKYFNSNGNYLTHSDWRKMWRDVMHLDYEPQVSVRAIRDATARAVAEVAKYPVKMDGLLRIKNKNKAALALIQLKRGIHNCRFITFGGDFREYKRQLELDDVETGDLVHVEADAKELNAVAMVLFRYRADVGAYIC